MLGIGPDDRTWGYLPFFFAGGLVAVALATLSRGGAVVLQDVFEPGETLRLLERERVHGVLRVAASGRGADRASALPRRHVCVLHKGVGANTKWAAAIYPPDHQAVGSYGMTETPPLCTRMAVGRAAGAAHRRATVRPSGSRELRIVDPETGAPLPRRSRRRDPRARPDAAARLLQARRRAAASTPTASSTPATSGRSTTDGALHFVGRLKDVIKTAGANVAAAEVEAVLARASRRGGRARGRRAGPGARRERGGVRRAEAVAVEADVARRALSRPARELQGAALRIWLRREDELPLKGSGKVDKAALRAEATRAHSRRRPPVIAASARSVSGT